MEPIVKASTWAERAVPVLWDLEQTRLTLAPTPLVNWLTKLRGELSWPNREVAQAALAPACSWLAELFKAAQQDAAAAVLVGHMPGEEVTPEQWNEIRAWIAEQEDRLADGSLHPDYRPQVELPLTVVRLLLDHVRHLDGYLAKLSHDSDAWQAGLEAGRMEAETLAHKARLHGGDRMKEACVKAARAACEVPGATAQDVMNAVESARFARAPTV